MVTSFGFNNGSSSSPSTFLILHCFMAVYASCFMPFVSVVLNSIVRQCEYAADRYAVSLGYDIRLALLDLSKENLGDLNPDPWYSSYFYTHPDLVSRLEAVTAQMGGAPMPEDVVTQYVSMPTVTKESKADTKADPATAVTATATAETRNVQKDESDDEDTAANNGVPQTTAKEVSIPPPKNQKTIYKNTPGIIPDVAVPSHVMAPPSDPPPPTGIAARIGTIEMAAEKNKPSENEEEEEELPILY